MKLLGAAPYGLSRSGAMQPELQILAGFTMQFVKK